jgi:hypothetical protein
VPQSDKSDFHDESSSLVAQLAPENQLLNPSPSVCNIRMARREAEEKSAVNQ